MKWLGRLPFERKPTAPMLYIDILFDEEKFRKQEEDQLQAAGVTNPPDSNYLGSFKIKNILNLVTFHVHEDKTIQQPQPPEEV